MRMMKCVVMLGIVLASFSSTALAQDVYTIQGVVKDAHTGALLSNANVIIEDLRLGTATDVDGRFKITNVVAGEHVFSVGFIGYNIYKEKINLLQNLELAVSLSPRILTGQQVVVTAERAVERETPVAFSDMNREYIEQNYWAQDIPMLLSEMPNVYSYSDAGNGIGYSYLKIRGFDQKRVGVMINGIPLNDPEDHEVYWVDIPDFAANIEDIQIQRGVTNSLYGISAFGGSVNLVTSTLSRERGMSATVGMGSFNTKKFSVAMNSGLVDNSYAVYARFSRIVTNGYRERSGVDLWSYFLTAVKYGVRSTTRLNIYGGPELTHAAWDAVRQDVLKTNRRFNPTSSGYDNTIDNFNQQHYEVIHELQLSPALSLNNTLFYVKGKGYYEGLKTRKKLVDFGLQSIQTADANLFGEDSLRYYVTTEINGEEILVRDESGFFTLKRTNLVRQKWVEKDHIGWMPRLDWNHCHGKLTLGGELSDYRGRHWGKVIWAAALPGAASPDLTYYTYFGDKTTAALYAHELLTVHERLQLMGDLQLQVKKYRFHHDPMANFVGAERNAYEIDYKFVNPKFGINYNLSEKTNLFASASIAQREPADDDYYDTWEGPDDLGADPLFARTDTVYSASRVDKVEWKDPLIEPEKVFDYEIGIGYRSPILHFKANAYLMDFRNEIIPYGQVDDDGNPIRGNAEKTMHRGLEFSLGANITSHLRYASNLSVSDNYYSKFIYRFWDENWNVVPIDYSGNTIPLFPSLLANARLSYDIAGLTLSAHLQHVGRQYLDNTEDSSRSLNPFSVVNLSASYRFRNILGMRSIAVSLRLSNVLDSKYETSGYYDPWEGANFLYPAATRNYYFAISTSL